MAVDGYVKAAHSQLTSAITALQSEIGDLQRELQNQKQNIGRDISMLESEAMIHKVAEKEENSQTDSTVLRTRLNAISKKRDEKAAEVHRTEQEINAAIQAKNQGMAEIQRALGAVNGLMSSSNLR